MTASFLFSKSRSVRCCSVQLALALSSASSARFFIYKIFKFLISVLAAERDCCNSRRSFFRLLMDSGPSRSCGAIGVAL
eukprot:65405-Chlamydomonas_euryale.AAC.1